MKDGLVFFNRSEYLNKIKLSKSDLKLKPNVKYYLYDIWGKRIIADNTDFIFEVSARDVLFLYYKELSLN